MTVQNPDLFVDIHDEPIRFFVNRGSYRKETKTSIEKHGGAVVSAEYQAHYILSDTYLRSRKQTAYNYKYIQDCVDSNQLLDIADYALTATGAKNGQYKEAKGRGRNPFTKEEDEAIAEYLRGIDVSSWGGVKIYEEFAQDHPTHTAQSWKERAKKRIIPILKQSKGKQRQKSPSKDVAVVENIQPQPQSYTNEAEFVTYQDMFDQALKRLQVGPSVMTEALYMTSGLFEPAIELIKSDFNLGQMSAEMKRYVYTEKDDEQLLANEFNVLTKANASDRVSFLASFT